MRNGENQTSSDREDLLQSAARLIGGDDPPSEVYAVIKDMISAHVGEDFQRYADSEKFTPRIADLRMRLEAVRTDAIQLRSSFSSLMREWNDDVDRLTFQDVQALLRHAFAERLRPGLSARELSETVPEVLDSIEHMVSDRLRRLGGDSGGRTNLWKSRFGSAHYQLVFRAVHVLAVFRGRDALKASDQGEAAELARIFLTLAGEDPEAIDVLKHVKNAIREIRTNPAISD